MKNKKISYSMSDFVSVFTTSVSEDKLIYDNIFTNDKNITDNQEVIFSSCEDYSSRISGSHKRSKMNKWFLE